jgi:uncharacterized damage-inducible protein DinB
MQQLLTTQYELIKSARHVLFTYCESISADDLFKKSATFNNSSIIDLLVHNANTYISWIRNFGLDAEMPFYEGVDFTHLNEIKLLYNNVDLTVDEFLNKYSGDYLQAETKYIPRKGISLTLSPLQLFTHVITHEFHHKGQILTLSRSLGYIPVDTDAIRY